MTSKWKIAEIQVGATFEATFFINPVENSGYRYRATHLDGRRAPKVVLADDARVRPGVPCLVKVRAIEKADRDDRGAILVDFVRLQAFEPDDVYLEPAVKRKLQILLESGLNILLDGPQGCGKTVLARAIAKRLGLEFVFFNCGAVVEATDFLATIQVRAGAGGAPVTDFIKTDVLLALEEAAQRPERRYLVFFDEFNRCQESARNALMPALDATRRLFHPIRNEFFEISDNVQFIAAVNRGSEFSGVFGIDAAQLDRFAPLQMDYLPPTEEVKILRKKHPELSVTVVEHVVEIAHRVRNTAELSQGLSVRATDEACVYLKHPLMENDQHRLLPEVLQSSFCGRFPGRWNDVASEAGAVWAIINAALREFKKKS